MYYSLFKSKQEQNENVNGKLFCINISYRFCTKLRSLRGKNNNKQKLFIDVRLINRQIWLKKLKTVRILSLFKAVSSKIKWC